MNEYCLIEEWDPSFHLPDGAKAVALTQEVIFQLKEAGIDFITLEDFYSSGIIRDTSDEYIADQLKWFDGLDKIIQTIYPKAHSLDLKAGSAYYYWIKYSLDNIVLTVKILQIFVDQVKPSKISFIGVSYKEDYINIILSFQNAESTYSRLIEAVCQKNGVKFERLNYGEDKEGKKSENMRGSSEMLKGGRAAFLKQKAVHYIPPGFKEYLIDCKTQMSYLDVSLKSNSKIKKNKNVLISQYIHFLKGFYGDLRASGYNLSYKMKDTVKPLGGQCFFNREVIYNGQEEKSCADIQWDQVRKALTVCLNEWLDQYCSASAGHAFIERLMYFVQKMCPELIARTDQYKNYFKQRSIDAVVMHAVWNVDNHAMVTAARLSEETKLIGFAHGADAFECKSRFFYLIRQFDLYCPASEGERENDIGLRDHFQYKIPQIAEAPYFMERYSTKKKESFNKIEAGDRKVVLFMPIMSVPWPNRVMDKMQPFPMEYIKWHEALLDYFHQKKDYFFIWKGFFRPGQKFDYAQSLIKQEEYDNIIFSSEKFVPLLYRVDYLLCDMPGTAFFEGIAAGLPCLALYKPTDQILGKNALDEFGDIIKPRSTIQEGLDYVDEFLHSRLKEEKINIRIPEKDIFLIKVRQFIEDKKTDRKNINQIYLETH